MTDRLAITRLWQLISPTLPIGAFSYSQALEFAIDSGKLKNKQDIESWLKTQLTFSLASCDLPVLYRLMNAWQSGDTDAVSYWNHSVLAFRESAELYEEDCQIGSALRRLLIDLEISAAEVWQTETVSYVTMYALACHHWQIETAEAMAGFIWAWCENMVAAAVKLLPMGQTDGQRMLITLSSQIEDICQSAINCSDDDIGISLPNLAMASAFHETQYSRLFRS